MPLVARLALVVAVVALAAVVFSTVTGVLPRVVSTIGTALGGIADSVAPTASPSASLVPIPASPTLTAPGNAFTNQPTVTLNGTVPLDVVGRDGFVVRVYVTLPDAEPVAVREVAVGETPSFVVENLPLEPGRNDVTATLVGPGGESDPSPVIDLRPRHLEAEGHGHGARERRDGQRRDRDDHRKDPGQVHRRRPQRGERDVGHGHGRRQPGPSAWRSPSAPARTGSP